MVRTNRNEAFVFVSYRRSDASADAQWLAESVRSEFGDGSVFVDVANLKGGESFPSRLVEEITAALAVIVVIGPTWLCAQDKSSGERLLSMEEDWVRKEIAIAFQTGKTVIPILVGGAKMPLVDANLPSDISEISTLQAMEVRPDHRAQDQKLVIHRLQQIGLGEIDPYPELRQFIQKYEDAEIYRRGIYAPLSGRTYSNRKIENIVSHIQGEMENSASARRILVLGDLGSGKSTTATRLAYELSSKLLCGEGELVPLFVDLSTVSDSSLPHIIENRLQKSYFGVRSSVSFLIILDGVDEWIPPSLSLHGYRSIHQKLHELEALQSKGVHVVLFCRTSFFRNEMELSKFRTRTPLSSIGEVEPEFCINIERLSERVVGKYLSARFCDSVSAEILEIVRKTYNLEELSKSPLLLNMIAMSAENGYLKAMRTRADLYERFVGDCLERDGWRAVVSSEDRLEICEMLAAKMMMEGLSCLSDSQIRLVIKEFGVSSSPIEQGLIAHEIENCSLFKRTHESFSFSHKSYQEYLSARYIVGLARERKDCEVDFYSSHETDEFALEILRTRADASKVLIGWFESVESRLKVFAMYYLRELRAPVDQLLPTAMMSSDTVVRLLAVDAASANMTNSVVSELKSALNRERHPYVKIWINWVLANSRKRVFSVPEEILDEARLNVEENFSRVTVDLTYWSIRVVRLCKISSEYRSVLNRLVCDETVDELVAREARLAIAELDEEVA